LEGIEKIGLIVRAALRGRPNACAIVGKTGDHKGSPVHVRSMFLQVLSADLLVRSSPKSPIDDMEQRWTAGVDTEIWDKSTEH
jgi:hypothetical protein